VFLRPASTPTTTPENFPPPTHGSLEWTGRGGSNGLRAHFTRATISTCRLSHWLQTSRPRQSSTGRFGAVSLGHLGGVWLDLVLTVLAPNDEPELGSGGAPQRHRRAGLGFHRGLRHH
jgi:hypothetical protein